VTSAAPTPGVAHRATGAELWLRDMDGRGLRLVSLAQAELLVSEGAAYPVIKQNSQSVKRWQGQALTLGFSRVVWW